MVMRKEITLGNLLGIFVPIFVLLFGWGISINSRMESQDVSVKNLEKITDKNEVKIEKIDDKIEVNFRIIQEKLDKIILKGQS